MSESKKMKEFKMMLIGDVGVGKSQAIKTLFERNGGDYNSEEIDKFTRNKM